MQSLLEYLKQLLTEKGVSVAWVLTNESNIPAVKLYEKTGGKRQNKDDVMFDYVLSSGK